MYHFLQTNISSKAKSVYSSRSCMTARIRAATFFFACRFHDGRKIKGGPQKLTCTPIPRLFRLHPRYPRPTCLHRSFCSVPCHSVWAANSAHPVLNKSNYELLLAKHLLKLNIRKHYMLSPRWLQLLQP